MGRGEGNTGGELPRQMAREMGMSQLEERYLVGLGELCAKADSLHEPYRVVLDLVANGGDKSTQQKRAATLQSILSEAEGVVEARGGLYLDYVRGLALIEVKDRLDAFQKITALKKEISSKWHPGRGNGVISWSFRSQLPDK